MDPAADRRVSTCDVASAPQSTVTAARKPAGPHEVVAVRESRCAVRESCGAIREHHGCQASDDRVQVRVAVASNACTITELFFRLMDTCASSF
jgi:hypothetical protein